VHLSDPLAILLHQLGKNSDNFAAEMLLVQLSLAHAVTSEQSGTIRTVGSSVRGAQALETWLTRIAPDPSTRIENGSGLFDANRLSAKTLTKLLVHTYRNPATQAEFTSQLAIGGTDGTLASRFREQRTTQRIRAKTGTLRHSVALSGYVLRSKNEPPLAFSILVDGIKNTSAARELIDQLVLSLVAF
jgi:D-alanyl-D-alanine carboxypeptidase/D-alanyl-D-alanine-endopeptidase (penicillin-binding protein 4)